MADTDLTQDIVRELIDYNSSTGTIKWKWRSRKWFASNQSFMRWNNKFHGKEIRCLNDYGYVKVSIFNKRYMGHRIIWLWMTGDWPEQIDHINHNRADNRWINLRAVGYAENSKNRAMLSNNSSGVTGVRWKKANAKWYAGIGVNGRKIHLGCFASKDDAIAARQHAEADFGFHTTHGVRIGQ